MLYSIVGIDYHKNRAVSTKSFENTPLSAGCKKKRGKLWQKERGLDGASPLDKVCFERNFSQSNVNVSINILQPSHPLHLQRDYIRAVGNGIGLSSVLWQRNS